MFVTLHTNHGDIKLQLNAEKAPKTVANFIEYAESGHYHGTLFHRVIPNFMIQGGGMTAGLTPKKTNAPIENEADNGLLNTKGSVAMARTNDPHSATCQFFINVADNDFLNFRAANPAGFGYCVFGEVVDGMDVVEAIRNVKTTSQFPHDDVPVDDVVIESTTVSAE